MKWISGFLVCFGIQIYVNAQVEVPHFNRQWIGDTGCSFYAPADTVEFELSYSEDSSEVWTSSTIIGDFGYELICVAFAEPIGETAEDYEMLATSYLDFLKDQFLITESAGYGYGHTMESAPDAIGVIDYWTDSEGDLWKVKVWANANYMGCLFIWGPSEVNESVAQAYLNGFRFPE